MANNLFFNRDLSWLFFNERVLMQAEKKNVPLLERLKFLSIFSSNLDEFYRVRMPVLMALKKIANKKFTTNRLTEISNYANAKELISNQQRYFGSILTKKLIPALKEKNISLLYNQPIPESIQAEVKNYFFSTLAAYLQIVFLTETSDFFPQNSLLYFAVELKKDEDKKIAIVNIPSDSVPRFFCTTVKHTHFVVFIDDIIKEQLINLFPDYQIKGIYSFKVTRDADLNLQDEYEGNLATKIEAQLTKRDLGLATRFLYAPDLPKHLLKSISRKLKLQKANKVSGGYYHNLKDFFAFPIQNASLLYEQHPSLHYPFPHNLQSLFEEIQLEDILVHTPYQSFDTVLRFFNEAVINPEVEEIFTTMYRVANDSRIGHALMSAARNGKKVTVFIELKARFDEANNIKWSKVMKAAGVKIIYSIPDLKVHSKVALVKLKSSNKKTLLGLLGTGNLNEKTAAIYTDHFLLTAHQEMLQELEQLFMFLAKRRKSSQEDQFELKHLLIAQFNLYQQFISLIDTEISHALAGLPAAIIIKINNLEEETLIAKLYEASNAGVKIHLIVRSVCRLVPGIQNLSEHISIRRIVDRYLEHGRVFIFHNNGAEKIFLGSSDWMNRNIYHRIEVCFPIYDEQLKRQIKDITLLQFRDDVSAVSVDENSVNIPLVNALGIRSQEAIYDYLSNKINATVDV
ncbi:Polyphosphate kinase [Arcticibacter svalbardensis MN12-7]|uniref:Polyphosphate kinase n=1 Tax=Arcticibacter svalbardensis MN12-7 TaxID=1150600 RepID=R9GYA0_9SPHI|nr:polyphosphate kinase 1 [Arcticibacter svalbardensis]EOR96485.1 Polyphosphate kinase [Arcticibacter svalbardensis MN12-7]